MNLIADGLLMATAMVAGLYCLVLSHRLRRLTDSSSGIGSQIDALNRTLEETRGALCETREGVSELRASARAAIAELKHRTGSGEQVASALGEATGRAEAVLQRLYEAQERIHALEGEAPISLGARPRNGEDAGSVAARGAVVLDVQAAVDRVGRRVGGKGADASEEHDRGVQEPEAKPAGRSPAGTAPEEGLADGKERGMET